MATTTLNIPVEVPTTGNYSINELKEKLMAYALMLVNIPKHEATATPTTKHSTWVDSMAKYRVLDPIDDKQEMLNSLDERYK